MFCKEQFSCEIIRLRATAKPHRIGIETCIRNWTDHFYNTLIRCTSQQNSILNDRRTLF